MFGASLAGDIITADGPGVDTPGTSATVSPTTPSPGGTLFFRVTGFPAGETINDSFVYAIRLANGTLAYATVTISMPRLSSRVKWRS